MILKSRTAEVLRAAAADGQRLYELDTGSSGNDDVLYGLDADEVVADVMFYHALSEWPSGWTLREIHPNELPA